MHDIFTKLSPVDASPPDHRFQPMVSHVSQQPDPAPFAFTAVGDLEWCEPEFLIDEVIEIETLGMIFGDPGCGKSFLAVDIAMSVGSGTPFNNGQVKKGSVFFTAGEGHNGLTRRFAGWEKNSGVPMSGLPVFLSHKGAQFLCPDSAKAVAKAVDELAKLHGKPALIIIDTVARNFGSGDENSTKDMNDFIQAMDDLKARYPGCTVLLVHHSGHADKHRARGAMALKGALDFEYRLEKKGDALRLINTKMKDAETSADQHFVLENVLLSDNASSAVLRGTAPPAKSHLKLSQRLGIETYTAAAIKNGIWEEEVFRGVKVEIWRDVFYAKHASQNTDAKKKAFQRVRAELKENSMMKADSDVYLCTDHNLQTEIMTLRDNRDMEGHSLKCPDAEIEQAGTAGTNA